MEHFPVSLVVSRGAYGLLAKKAPSTGVIFVHGFQGNPRATWIDFQGLVEEIGNQRALWGEADLFFYAYRSRDQIRPLAEDFVKFLMSVAVTKEAGVVPRNYVLPSSENLTIGVPADISGLRGTKPYRNLILVGHSTGGVIIREALRLIITQTPEVELNALVRNSNLRFFAPAHLGVLAAGKLGLAQSLPILDRIFGAFLRSNPLYQNLGPSSPTILDLRKSTEQLYSERKFPALKASSLFGQHEEIVVVGEYSHDDVTPTEPTHSHISICKPTATYLKPLEFVANGFAIAKIA
jgi:pimeloyl-ACP methyl ester carboxylesterase